VQLPADEYVGGLCELLSLALLLEFFLGWTLTSSEPIVEEIKIVYLVGSLARYRTIYVLRKILLV